MPREKTPTRKKSAKPYPDFPLTLHKGSGQWCKKIQGRIHYFGTEAEAALNKYLDERDDLQAGRVPRHADSGGLRLRDLVNQYLTHKQSMVDSGEITDRTFAEYHRSCSLLIDQFGKHRSIEDLIPLWPETIKSLEDSMQKRPDAAEPGDENLVFITKYGNRWVRSNRRQTADGKTRLVTNDRVASEFSKVLKDLGLKRQGLNFYALRHTFETIGGESRDQVAVDAIMGHVRDDMASLYHERISDERLTAVTDFVRKWTFTE